MPREAQPVPTGMLRKGATETWFVVQAYRKMGKRLVADEPKMARDAEHCLALAERLAETRDAVVAFSRKGDLDTGDYDDPVILASYGDVPEMG